MEKNQYGGKRFKKKKVLENKILEIMGEKEKEVK